MADDPNPTGMAAPTPAASPTSATTSEPASALGGALATAPAAEPTTPTEPAKPVVPEKYADWSLPDGYELDSGVSEKASGLFKELGLTQEQGQKLVDLYSAEAVKSHQEMIDAFWNQRREWRDSMKTDPGLKDLRFNGDNIAADSPLVVTVNRALEGLQNPKLVADFKAAMNDTGAGDHPALVKVLHALAKQVTEGTTYARGNPVAPAKRPSPGEAIYGPNGPLGAGQRAGAAT